MRDSHKAHHHELVVDQLGVCYRGVRALEGVGFATSCGHCVALIGPNGAGKSTLLKAIAGLLRPVSGRVLWRGTPVRRWSREIAYLPQREDVDWSFPITVRGVVRMGRYPSTGWWRPYRREDEEAVDRAMEHLELHALGDRQISELSGGQQQRVFLARALAQEAHVLLLDEPFTGLDRPSAESLARLLPQMAREGRLILASHHDLHTVETIYDQALLLHQNVVAFGSLGDVFQEPRLEALFSVAGERKEGA